MNRQIYGFTLFVFIVKATFLIYWVFLAPVSFLRILKFDAEPQTVEARQKNCSKSDVYLSDHYLIAKIANAQIDSEGSLKAVLNVDYNTDLADAVLTPNFNLFLFDDHSNLVWQGSKRLPLVRSEFAGSLTFETAAEELSNLSFKRNYYLQVDQPRFNLCDAKQVLLAH